MVMQREQQLAQAWAQLGCKSQMTHPPPNVSFSSTFPVPLPVVTTPRVTVASPMTVMPPQVSCNGQARHHGAGSQHPTTTHPPPFTSSKPPPAFNFDNYNQLHTGSRPSPRETSVPDRMGGGASTDDADTNEAVASPLFGSGSLDDWESLVASSFGLSTAEARDLLQASQVPAPAKENQPPPRVEPIGSHRQPSVFFASSPMAGKDRMEVGPTSPAALSQLSAIGGGGLGTGYWSQGSSPGSTTTNHSGEGEKQRSVGVVDSGLGSECSKLFHHH